MTSCPRPRAAWVSVRLAVPDPGHRADQATFRPCRAAASHLRGRFTPETEALIEELLPTPAYQQAG